MTLSCWEWALIKMWTVFKVTFRQQMPRNAGRASLLCELARADYRGLPSPPLKKRLLHQATSPPLPPNKNNAVSRISQHHISLALSDCHWTGRCIMSANNQRGLLVEPMFVMCYCIWIISLMCFLLMQTHAYRLETALAQKLESLDNALSYSQNCFKDYRQEMYEATCHTG